MEASGPSGELGSPKAPSYGGAQRDILKTIFIDSSNSEELLGLLDGLPLALAQAGAYLGVEHGLDIATHVQFYKQQWKELMESHDRSGFPLLDYPERSVLTTWMISFNAIKAMNEAATNLLLLWAFLDNKDLWHGLLHAATVSTEHWPEWLQVMEPMSLDLSRMPSFYRTIQ